MRVFMPRRVMESAESVAPNLIVAADAMNQVFARKGEQGSVKGHVIRAIREFFQNLRGTERRARVGEDRQNTGSHRRTPQARFMQQIGGFSHRFVHNRNYSICLSPMGEAQLSDGNYSTAYPGAIFRAYRCLRPK